MVFSSKGSSGKKEKVVRTHAQSENVSPIAAHHSKKKQLHCHKPTHPKIGWQFSLTKHTTRAAKYGERGEYCSQEISIENGPARRFSILILSRLEI
jgi:hypothetical protein